jgi:hypothetical protein
MDTFAIVNFTKIDNVTTIQVADPDPHQRSGDTIPDKDLCHFFTKCL